MATDLAYYSITLNVKQKKGSENVFLWMHEDYQVTNMNFMYYSFHLYWM
jgi:hypothetical protein